MNIVANMWNIVWQDTPFHKAIAIIFVFFIILEIFITLRYLLLDKTKYRKLQTPPRSPLRFVTALCTSIGVLGTFYGIQQGLQGLNLGDISNSQQLMTSSTELLVSMKTAFSTSLMGLGSGSLFTIVLFFTDSLRKIRRNILRNQFTVNNSQNLVKEIEQLRKSLINQQSPTAKEIGEATGKSIADEFAGINQLTSEAIGKAVGKQIHSMVLPGISRIIEEQERIRELQENQGQQVFEQLIEELRIQIIEPVAQRLDESAELTRQASQAVTSLHNELGGISQSLASSIETIQNFQQETLVELQNFANNLGETLNQFQTDTTSVLQQTAQQINSAVDQSIVGMTAQREAFRESADQAAVTFRGIRGELEQALHTQTQQQQKMLEGVQSSTQEILNTANATFKQQTDTLSAVGNQASGLMNSAKEKLLATLGTIDQTLTKTRQTVQDDLTKFRNEYQNNLNNFFERQNNLLEETLGLQRDGLSEVVTNLNTVFKEEYNRRSELSNQVNQSMNKVSEAATDINQLACAVGLNSSNSLVQLENVARDLNQQVQGVRGEYRQLSNTFQESLTAWTNHFGESREKFFNQADSSMANVCSSLLQTAEVLVAANNNRNNGNGG